MQTGNNDMDKKLRQLENQSLPDLSKQDKHWQQMQTMLQPAMVPAKKENGLFKKPWHWLLAACIISAVSVVGYKLLQPASEKPMVNNPPPILPAHTNTTAKKIKDSVPNGIAMKIQDGQQTIPVHNGQPVKREPASNRVISKKDTVIILPMVTNEPVKKDDDAAMLAGFFQQLEKETQQFLIDNRKDTVITGKDGTALLIMANTFNTAGKILITLKEYYSYQDIITNKLSTCSDGQQLVTGGMIHLTATADGKAVDMRPSKSIRWFVPDTSSAMSDMQVFTGSTGGSVSDDGDNVHRDTVAWAANSSINWKTQERSFIRDYVTIKVKVLDLRDAPYKVTTGRKYKGFFFINENSTFSKDELEKELKKKNPWYDKVIVTRRKIAKEWTETRTSFFFAEREGISYVSVGDSAWVAPSVAKAYKLPASDTMTYTNKSSTQKNTPSLNTQLKKVAAKYSVDITSLGWINCDKFYQGKGPKIDYVVNIGDSASNYYTFLAFDRIKSMMSGNVAGNKVVFSGVPVGEKVKVISVGIRNGKPVAAMSPTEISSATLTGLKFEETTPAAFKEQAGTMDRE